MTLRRIAAALVPLTLGACLLNQAGHIAASRMGDTSHPARRGSPVAALRQACGEGDLTAAGAAALRRQPFLQQVSAGAATVGWITTAPAGQRVEVTAPAAAPPDATPVVTVTLRRETTASRVDQSQMWARLDGLAPATTYCYALAGDAGALTEPTGFRTAPAADSVEPVRFLAFGDSGKGGSDQYALVAQMYRYPYELILHMGDLAYDSGTVDELQARVFSVYAELFRNLPFFPVAGNHEYKTRRAQPFRDAFALPDGERSYSFDWGRVHFAAIDTELDYRAQAAWLDRDLAASRLPWRIVYLHKAPYSSGAHGSDGALRAALAPVLERHRVQLVLSGHEHHYERMRPQKGVTYVISGGGGAGVRPVGSSSFTAFSDAVIHFVYGEVGVDTLTLHAIDATGTEFDSVVIPR